MARFKMHKRRYEVFVRLYKRSHNNNNTKQSNACVLVFVVRELLINGYLKKTANVSNE